MRLFGDNNTGGKAYGLCVQIPDLWISISIFYDDHFPMSFKYRLAATAFGTRSAAFSGGIIFYRRLLCE